MVAGMKGDRELLRSTSANQYDAILPGHALPENALPEEADIVGNASREESPGHGIDQHNPMLQKDDLDTIAATECNSELASDTDIESQRPSNMQRPSNASTMFPSPQPVIYKRTPMVMIFGLLIGISCSVGHNFWYVWLDGRLVGNSHKQQQALRAGTTLAVCAQVSLVFSIQKAYKQWLWRELKSHIVTFRGIDAACAASIDPSSFANIEMWRKAKRASMLALISWLIPISTFITPATLNVREVMLETIRSIKVPTLNIAQAGQYASYAFAVADSQSTSEKFLGPRTIISRWTVATASTDEIPNLPQPATNATYTQTYYAPYVHCDNSTTEVIQQINGMIDRFQQVQDHSVKLKLIDYYAAIPDLSNLANNSGPVQVVNLTEDAAYASNQLWIYYSSYKASLNFPVAVDKHYLTCQLFNATLKVRFTWENGRQDLQVLDRVLLNPVAYPANASTSPESELSMSYSSLMWALSTQLMGSISFYQDLNATKDVTPETSASRVYSKITTNIAQTVLASTPVL